MPAQTITVQSQDSFGDIDWVGTERYEIRRQLGHGGMGVVYEAFDRERQQPIALKTVLNFSPDALYLFKQEFRTLADVQHPNLVHLYELVAKEPERLFFTMELVPGTDFVTHSQRADAPARSRAAADADVKSRERATERPQALRRDAPRPAATPRTSPADIDKLRPALRQLAEGVHALHVAGKLHRDIKPSNVLVNPEGRVVLLDFGVATDLAHGDESGGDEGQVVGTANYMAPEQGTGEPPTAACDWYSVGVMLYEALVGAPPFVGSMMDVIMMKNTLEPRAPSSVVGGVPADLDALCMDLLRTLPEERPTGLALLAQLGVRGSPSQAPPRPSRLPFADGPTKPRLVGRDAHLKSLRDAFEATLGGKPVTIRVSGRSGMGKSSLVDRFLDDLVERGEAVVLRGRAYQRESVPFKAVDSVIDALSRYLMRLTDRSQALTLPNAIGALARVFPVLRRVSSVQEASEPQFTNPQRVRTLAFAALRDLLRSLTRRQPLVIYIDDAQWGDNDSAALLLDLMHPSDAPPLLLVMAHREEEASASSFLLETSARWPERAELRDLHVGPLDVDDARSLAATLLAENDLEVDPSAADAIARESSGNPFLIDELARSVSGEHRVGPTRDASPGTAVTLEQVIGRRVGRLPSHAARFLEVVAVAGSPLSLTVVRAASEVEESAEEVVALLRDRRFVRAGLRDGHEVVEASHDRIRETIVASLSDSVVRDHHRRLATVLEGRSGVEAEAVAVHLFGAGENARAADYAERAAQEAIAKLAFEQGARLLRLTLATTDPASARAQAVRVRLGEALKWAGRSSEAGTVYLEAAAHAAALERATFEREAAEQLLASGRLAEGSVVLGRVLNAVGLAEPRSPLSALFWLLVYRFWLNVVGVSFKEKRAADIPPDVQLRLKAMLAAGNGYWSVNVIYGACVQARYLLMALRAGDPLHILRAATFEVSHLASMGGTPGRRERVLLQLAERLGENLSDIEVGMTVEGMRGVSLFLRGHWKRARELYDIEYAKYRHARAGGHTAASLFSLFSLFFLGEIRELGRRRTQMLIEAEQRGDLYMTVNLRASVAASVWLAADEPATARRQVREAMALWPKDIYLTTHWQALVCEVELDLYEGNGVSAYERIVREQNQVNRSFILNVQFVRAAHFFLRGRAAIASAAVQPEVRDKRIAEARSMAKRLERERMPWTSALSATLNASLANLAGNRHAAIAALRAMIDLGQAADMPTTVNAARYRLGTLLGPEPDGLLERAQEAMSTEDIKCPARWVQLLLPGQWPEA